MKKIITSTICAAIAVVATALICGCEPTVPTVEKMTNVSTAVGKAAGYAVELSKTKTSVKEGIISVLDITSKVVPETNETFAVTWEPVINEEVEKLVDNGKISEDEASIVKQTLYVASEGIDYVFSRYPEAKTYQELVSAAVAGFNTGFRSVVKFAVGQESDYDKEAYEFLRAKFTAAK